jgi:hypothetical protein
MNIELFRDVADAVIAGIIDADGAVSGMEPGTGAGDGAPRR